MILLIDLCYRPHSLGEDEFVRPIADIVKRCGYQSEMCHFTEWESVAMDTVEAVILCGTPLRDTLFKERPECFTWITESPVPILGIGAGMQALVIAYGGNLEPNSEIGMTTIRGVSDADPIFCEKQWTAYELHRFSTVPENIFMILAESDACIQAIRHREHPIYGVLFDPEVRNIWVVERFLSTHVCHNIIPSSE